MRAAHFTAFSDAVKAAIPALASVTYDGDAPLDANGNVVKASYLVLHDMGFDAQDDGRLTGEVEDVSDGTYRVIVRAVAIGRFGLRDTIDTLKAGLTGVVLNITDRACGPIQKDHGPDAIQRDDTVSPPLFFADLDFIWRSSRA